MLNSAENILKQWGRRFLTDQPAVAVRVLTTPCAFLSKALPCWISIQYFHNLILGAKLGSAHLTVPRAFVTLQMFTNLILN